MPHNNRMHSSAALKMTGIWTNTIGYDPYAAEGEGGKKDTGLDDGDSGMDQFKGLLKLAAAQNGVRCCAVWGALALTAPPAPPFDVMLRCTANSPVLASRGAAPVLPSNLVYLTDTSTRLRFQSSENRGAWKGRGQLKGGWVGVLANGTQIASEQTEDERKLQYAVSSDDDDDSSDSSDSDDSSGSSSSDDERRGRSDRSER